MQNAFAQGVGGDAAAADLEGLLREGFAIEHRYWKGRSGSSVLAMPGLFKFVLEKAREFAARGELSLVFLRHDGRRIAFQYAYRARGTYFLPKIGYDERYARYSPGHALTYEMTPAGG